MPSFNFGARHACMPALTSKFFGTKNVGSIIAFMGFGPTIGGVFGPFLAGYIFDSSGSYYFAFLLGATANILATAFAVWAEKLEKS